MRHEGMRNEDENVAQTTASDLRAVAQDMLRMGRHWARAAQDWLERAGDEAQRQARTRSDRDLQSDYSSGGYDQVDTGRSGAYGSQAYGAGYGSQAYGAYAYGADSYPGGRDFGGRDYRGVGPRNYTRSDDRIREDLNERLTEAYDLDASGLAVEVENGVATLSGHVPQRWMKHRAEDLADGCIGVRDVRNHIMVGSGSSTDTYGKDSGGAASTGSAYGSSASAGNAGSTGTTGTAGTTTGYAGSTGKETP